MSAVAMATQAGLEQLLPAHLINQADNYKTRYVCLFVFDVPSVAQLGLSGPLRAGCISKLAPPARGYRPDELTCADIKRDQVQEVVKVSEGRELWVYAEPARPVLDAVLRSSGSFGVELAALIGCDLSPALLEQVNGWLFSRGTQTRATTHTSLERAGDGEWYAQQGFPADARDIFKGVLDAVRDGFLRAEKALEEEFAGYVQAYRASLTPNSGVTFHQSARYQQVRDWLGEVDVVEYQQRHANAGIEALMTGIAKLEERQAKIEDALATALTSIADSNNKLATSLATWQPQPAQVQEPVAKTKAPAKTQ